MSGVVIPKAPIAIDWWKKAAGVKFFFLTHMHTDHIAGFNREWNNGVIICSEVTRNLLLHRFEIDPRVVHAMKYDQPEIFDLNRPGTISMTVTAFDARHCPGSTMFLLEGYFGKILHTGDAKFDTDMFRSIAGRYLTRAKIDRLYLDNTNLDPSKEFPSPDDVMYKELLPLIAQYPRHRILLGLNKFGDEEFARKIAVALDAKVSVPMSKMKEIEQMNFENGIFTTSLTGARIKIIDRQDMTKTKIGQHNKHPTLCILPAVHRPDTKIVHTEYNIVMVHTPYMFHSTFSEIVDFVRHIKPKSISPIVRGKNADVFKHLGRYMDPEPSLDYFIPESVEDYLNLPRSVNSAHGLQVYNMDDDTEDEDEEDS